MSAIATPSAATILRQGGVCLCKACSGDLIAYEGRLRCGFCGAFEDEAVPIVQAPVPVKTATQLLEERVRTLTRERDEARRRNLELERKRK